MEKRKTGKERKRELNKLRGTKERGKKEDVKIKPKREKKTTGEWKREIARMM